jgi:hypothetical protein
MGIMCRLCLFVDIGDKGSQELADSLSTLVDMLNKHKGMRVDRLWAEINQ